MNNNRNKLFLVVLASLLVVAAGAFVYSSQQMPNPIPLSTEDKNIVWNFQASHDDNGPLEEKVRAEISTLKERMGNADFIDQEYLISIANQYSLIGEGKNAYKYLIKAINLGGAESGLAWSNMGQVLVRIGAIKSASIAYDNAVQAGPAELSFHKAKIEFLLRYFPSEGVKIEKAFADADLGLGENLSTLQLRAIWLKDQGKVAEAIVVLKKMRTMLPAVSRGPIDAELAFLSKNL